MPIDPRLRIRPRSPWEAIDLGVMLTRRWWRHIFPAWIVIAGAIFALLHVATGGRMVAAAFLFWLLKPAFDRVLLPIYSQALFDQPPTFRETLRRLPRALRGGGLWLNLTLLRLNPARSFHLPVWQLEGLRGRQRAARIGVLGKQIRGYPIWLLIACQTMEQVLAFAPLTLLAFFAARALNKPVVDVLFGETAPLAMEIAGSLIYFLAVILIEPIYVAAGFMLYIDRRAKLEGWDIELAFRRLGERLRQGVRAAAALLLGAILLWTPPDPALAAPPTDAESRAAIEAVLNSPELNRHETRWIWRRRAGEAPPQPSSDQTEWLEHLGAWLATLFRGALWAIAALLTLLLIVYRRRWLRVSWRRPAPRSESETTEAAGLDIRPESLPGDVPRAASALIDQGRPREALALLYRASLSRLQQRDRLPLRRGHTEGEILALADNRLPPARRHYLERLTRIWRQVAYGSEAVAPQTVLELCRSWPLFDGEAS